MSRSDPVTVLDAAAIRRLAISAQFLAEQLGHAKSFSLDTEKAMAKRCASIRKIARDS